MIPTRFGPEHLDLARLRHEREVPPATNLLAEATTPASMGPAAAPVMPSPGSEKRHEPDLLTLANVTAARLDALEQRMARRFEAMTVTLAQALAEVITTELRRR